MLDLSQFTGIRQFGPAYGVMLENDPHAPGSVDRVLMERMVRLCTDTAGYLYERHTSTTLEYRRGSRPGLENAIRTITKDRSSDEERVAAIARFCAALCERASTGIDTMRFGGTEEEIIRRTSDWCVDVARVGCALFQVTGLPSRIVYLADTGKAYSGHAVVEVYRSRTWGTVDVATGMVFRHGDGSPASTWCLMNQPKLVEAHGPAPYTYAGQFRVAAVSDYSIWESAKYDYTVSGVNQYYRSILQMSDQGWPGGLKWLNGEDDA